MPMEPPPRGKCYVNAQTNLAATPMLSVSSTTSPSARRSRAMRLGLSPPAAARRTVNLSPRRHRRNHDGVGASDPPDRGKPRKTDSRPPIPKGLRHRHDSHATEFCEWRSNDPFCVCTRGQPQPALDAQHAKAAQCVGGACPGPARQATNAAHNGAGRPKASQSGREARSPPRPERAPRARRNLRSTRLRGEGQRPLAAVQPKGERERPSVVHPPCRGPSVQPRLHRQTGCEAHSAMRGVDPHSTRVRRRQRGREGGRAGAPRPLEGLRKLSLDLLVAVSGFRDEFGSVAKATSSGWPPNSALKSPASRVGTTGGTRNSGATEVNLPKQMDM